MGTRRTETAPARTKLTPPEVARRYRISPEKVVGWIRSGELRAIDVSARSSSRPRYRIDPDDLAAFEERRRVVPAPEPGRRRRKHNPNITEYF